MNMEILRGKNRTIVFLLALAPVAYVLYRLGGVWLPLVTFLPALVLLGLHYRETFSRPVRIGFTVFVIGATLLFAARSLVAMRANLSDISEWDFVGFWIHGKTAVEGGNFYDPTFAREQAQSLTVSEDFRHEIIDVGFWYPAPTAFLFLPLGWFDLQPALVVWYGFQILVLMADIWLIWRLFLHGTGWLGLAASAVMLLGAYATILTIAFGQTNFVALLGLLLYWRDRDRPISGLWAAVAIFVKPFLAVLLLYQLLRQQGRIVAATIIAMAALSLFSIVFFGMDTFLDFFRGNVNQIADKPSFIYTEITNQSILGVVLRLTHTQLAPNQSPIFNPLFLAASGVVGLVTVWLTFRLAKTDEILGLALCVLLALLAYPVSQWFYSVLLVPIVLLFWQYRTRLAGGIWTLGTLVALTYALCAYDTGFVTAGANLLLWLAVALLSLHLTRHKVVEPVRSMKAVHQHG